MRVSETRTTKQENLCRRRMHVCMSLTVILRKTMAELSTLCRLCTFCALLYRYSIVVVIQMWLSWVTTLRRYSTHSRRKWHFWRVYLSNFRPKVAREVISGATEEDISLDVCVNLTFVGPTLLEMFIPLASIANNERRIRALWHQVQTLTRFA